MDDMMVKSRTLEDHLGDIQIVFNMLNKTSMKLNLEKYTFGVTVENFLWYIVSERGMEANLDKIKAIQDIKVFKCINDI